MKSKMIISLTTLFLILFSLAQEVDKSKRIITIAYDGGNRSAPDLRYGPYQYSHPEEEGLIATVSNLTIYGQNAELKAPEGVLISEAEGQRESIFSGGVRVTRGRLTALGKEITYSEQTGFGVLTAEDLVDITIEPKESDEDPAEITAETATFDVDTDISVSRGNVTLINGSQSAQADEMTFEEDRDLAKLVNEVGQVIATKQDEENGELIINADIMRVLTEEDKLFATGNVTLIDGDITSSGDTIFFDDTASRAEIIGNPAVSVNAAEGITISGARIEHLTDIDVIELLDDSVPTEFSEVEFLLTSELSEELPPNEEALPKVPDEEIEMLDEDLEKVLEEEIEMLNEDLEEVPEEVPAPPTNTLSPDIDNEKLDDNEDEGDKNETDKGEDVKNEDAKEEAIKDEGDKDKADAKDKDANENGE